MTRALGGVALVHTLGKFVRMEIRLLVFSSILSLTLFFRYSSYAKGSETALSLQKPKPRGQQWSRGSKQKRSRHKARAQDTTTSSKTRRQAETGKAEPPKGASRWVAVIGGRASCPSFFRRTSPGDEDRKIVRRADRWACCRNTLKGKMGAKCHDENRQRPSSLEPHTAISSRKEVTR